MPDHLVRVPLWSGELIAALGVLTSPAIDCRRADPDHMDFRVTSVASASPDVKIQVQFSPDNVTFNAVTAQDTLVPSSLLEWPVATFGAEEWHVMGVIPSGSWMKIVVTEISAGSIADTLVDAVLWLRESPVGAL
jgi:hypothetical protein